MRPEDRALAARDRDLPGLALLFDDATFAAMLRERLPDAGVRGARGTYVRYKPATNCLVGYEVDTATGTHHVHARAERPAESGKLRKRELKSAAGPLGAGTLVVEEPAVAVLAFPNDRRLPALPALAEPAPQILAYKPERRLVVRRGDKVVKAYTRDRFGSARAAAEALGAADGARLQRCLRASDRRAALTFEWVEGRLLDALIAAGDASGSAAEVATALAALHSCTPAGPLPRRSPEGRAAALRAAADAAAVAGPDVGAAAHRLAERLAARPPAGADARPLHGDFSIDQVVCGAGGPALLDLDRAALGDPAEDVGSALADLELRVLDGRLSRKVAETFAEELLAACPQHRSRAADHLAAGLLLRAAEPFRHRRPGWDALVAAAVERAATLAAATARPHRGRPAPAASPVDTRLHRGRTARHPGRALKALERLALPRGDEVTLRRAWPRPGRRLLLEYVGAGGVIGAQWQAGAPLHVHHGGADGRLPGLRPLLTRPHARLLAHRPTKRAAVALLGPSPAFVKVVRPERAAAVADAMDTAATLAGGAFRVPAVLTVDGGAGTVTCARVPGRPLSDLIGSPAGGPAARALGAAVRTLHEAPVPSASAMHDAATEAALVRRFASEVAPYAPAIAEAAAGAAETAAARLAALPAVPPGPLHRDLHDKQVLVDGRGEIGLIDFDTLAAGDPALDVANLLAHLELRALQGRCTAAAAAALADAFRAGYGSGDGLDERVPAYLAATRVRLACVYALRPSWPSLGEALLAAAASRSRVPIRASSSANENGLIR